MGGIERAFEIGQTSASRLNYDARRVPLDEEAPMKSIKGQYDVLAINQKAGRIFRQSLDTRPLIAMG